MENNYFARGTIPIGGHELSFVRRPIQGNYSMMVPEDFLADKNLVSNYTYLFSKDKSPLSIAIKFTPVDNTVEKRRKTEHYFGQSKGERLDPVETMEPGITYRETITGGTFLSIYSLRFAVETADGVLFGCFNSSADYKDDWRECVLAMLRSVEQQ